MTLPILEGLDGVQKMSKSLDNYISVIDTPKDMFGKTMRVSDELMFRYYELLTDIDVDELNALKGQMTSGEVHPRQLKVNLAKQLISRFHDVDKADQAEAEFNRIFVDKGLPDEIPEFELGRDAKWICHVMVEAGTCASTSEARRLIKGGGVKWGDEKVSDEKLQVQLSAGEDIVLKVGKKKFVRVKS